ncbi:MAG: dTDP-4-dehydrorhamnose reductase family protein [Actinomycetota bacterium]
MRVLVLGASGMLGHRVVQRLWDDVEVWATVRAGGSRLPAEILPDRSRLLEGVVAEDADSILRAMEVSRAAAVVNCIGIVKQQPAATDPLISVAVNSLLPHRVAELCRIGQSRLIHLSTDCVFSGKKGNYGENDPPDPDDLYGRTKLVGEVREGGALTLRTSMIGWQLSGSTGLLEWLSENRHGATRGFRRAIFSGLSTAALADVIAQLIQEETPLTGLYHVSADPISKFDLLRDVVTTLGWPTTIEPVDEPVLDRSLDSSAFREKMGWKPPAWSDMIAGLAAERPAYERWRAP